MIENTTSTDRCLAGLSDLQRLLTDIIYIMSGLKPGGGEGAGVFSGGPERMAAQLRASFQHYNCYDILADLGKIRSGLNDLARIIDACHGEKEAARDLLNSACEMMILLDLDLNVLAFNRAAVRDLGIGEEDGKRDGIGDLIGPELEVIKKAINKMIESGLSITWEGERGGRSFFKRACPIEESDGSIRKIALFMRDNTREKQTARELEACRETLYHLASELAVTEARERRGLAADIHDRIGQALFLANMKTDAVRKWIFDPDGRNALEEVTFFIGQAMEEAREMIMNISPPSLTMLGLEPALSVLAGEIQKKHRIEVEFYDDGLDKPLSEDVRDLAYRAARELMINAVKHARAKKIILSAAMKSDGIHIVIEDDGIGFNVAEVLGSRPQTAHFGLFCIRQRLDPLGGKLVLISKPGQGTRAELTVPRQTFDPISNGGLT